MTDFTINLNAKPYAHSIRQGWNKKGEVYDIEVLNANAVLEQWDLYLRAEHGLTSYDDAAFPLFRDWCNRNNVFFYGAPSDEFSMSEALDMAANRCSTYLLAEDLS
jgi:hypothetical protein